ncbi:MAG: hypothetical protein P4L35_14560 [Ignavibacteriaceae bacterium]|nr:hypothetical protein [Ignavibacteriaceae bacterium]
MGTLPPPATKHFPDDSTEKKVYKVVDKFREYLPIENDRNRLGFALFKYITGEGDEPGITLKSTKVKIEGISTQELANKLTIEINIIKDELK